MKRTVTLAILPLTKGGFLVTYVRRTQNGFDVHHAYMPD